jgi:hypothetical protein
MDVSWTSVSTKISMIKDRPSSFAALAPTIKRDNLESKQATDLRRQCTFDAWDAALTTNGGHNILAVCY